MARPLLKSGHPLRRAPKEVMPAALLKTPLSAAAAEPAVRDPPPQPLVNLLEGVAVGKTGGVKAVAIAVSTFEFVSPSAAAAAAITAATPLCGCLDPEWVVD